MWSWLHLLIPLPTNHRHQPATPHHIRAPTLAIALLMLSFGGKCAQGAMPALHPRLPTHSHLAPWHSHPYQPSMLQPPAPPLPPLRQEGLDHSRPRRRAHRKSNNHDSQRLQLHWNFYTNRHQFHHSLHINNIK